eukprot:scaffold240530_cov30-Tisochrysis_lutea.AAC.4
MNIQAGNRNTRDSPSHRLSRRTFPGDRWRGAQCLHHAGKSYPTHSDCTQLGWAQAARSPAGKAHKLACQTHWRRCRERTACTCHSKVWAPPHLRPDKWHQRRTACTPFGLVLACSCRPDMVCRSRSLHWADAHPVRTVGMTHGRLRG